VKQGYLTSIDDKVSTYMKEWRDDPQKVDITIRELLTLSSGIFSSPIPLMNIWTSIHGPFVGNMWFYGYQPFVVFAYVVELITGRSAQQYLDDELFNKLGVEVSIDSIGYPGEVTNFYSGGFGTIFDSYFPAIRRHILLTRLIFLVDSESS